MKAIRFVALCLLAVTISAHHHRKLGDSNGFNSDFKTDSNTMTAGTAVANGNGQVSVVANKDGVNSKAVGTKSTQGSTLFVQNYQAAANNNGFNNNGASANGGASNNGFSNNYTENRDTASATQAATVGQGGFETGTGINGAYGTAAGTDGSGIAAAWNQNQVTTSNSFGFNKKRLLMDKNLAHKSDSCEDNYGWNNNFADKSATKAAGASQSYGAGYSALSAGRAGVNTEAFGTKGAASKSAFEQQNNSWLNKNAYANKGGKTFGFNDNSATNNNTQSFTDARGFGEAGVKSNASSDGMNVFSKGSDGTENKGGWNGSNDDWRVQNAVGKNKRRLDVQADVVQKVDCKKTIDELKLQIQKLVIENAALKKNCNKKTLGASQ